MVARLIFSRWKNLFKLSKTGSTSISRAAKTMKLYWLICLKSPAATAFPFNASLPSSKTRLGQFWKILSRFCQAKPSYWTWLFQAFEVARVKGCMQLAKYFISRHGVLKKFENTLHIFGGVSHFLIADLHLMLQGTMDKGHAMNVDEKGWNSWQSDTHSLLTAKFNWRSIWHLSPSPVKLLALCWTHT